MTRHNTELCYCCQGTREITFTLHEEGGKVSTMQMPCVTCNGTGRVQKGAKARWDQFWCRCGNPSGDSHYHPDTPGSKHHWTCGDCGRVTQVG